MRRILQTIVLSVGLCSASCAMDPPRVTPSASTTQAVIAESHQRIDEARKKREQDYQKLEEDYQAYEQTYWPGLRENFPPLAKKLNYVCDKVSRFRPMGITERGSVYRIDCDQGSLSYRMLKTPDDNLIITPWTSR